MEEDIDYGEVPLLIVFDLDYTLWPLWVDTHISGPPFRAIASKPYRVTDKNGKEVKLYEDVPEILNLIRSFPNTRMAVASRTHAPDWAREILALIPFPSAKNVEEKSNFPSKRPKKGIYQTLADQIDYFEIYPGSKLNHFRALHTKTGVSYSDMIFFDDEARNQEVERDLGVKFVHVPKGLTMKIFLEALKEFNPS